MTATRETLLEAVFDILWPLQPWEGEESVCRAAADAALAAIEAAGWRIVPVEPTPLMVEAHYAAHATADTVFADAEAVWGHMLSAATRIAEKE